MATPLEIRRLTDAATLLITEDRDVGQGDRQAGAEGAIAVFKDRLPGDEADVIRKRK
jgi:hypothetical protein